MGYDRGDSFPLNFQPNGILFGSHPLAYAQGVSRRTFVQGAFEGALNGAPHSVETN